MAVTKKILKDVLISDEIVVDADVTGNLSDYLPLSGGTLTGDLNIFGANFRQTSTPGGQVYNFSGKNSFLQAEEAHSGAGDSYGPACTGSRGFPILSIDTAGNRLKLSGDLSDLERGMNMAFSYAFSSGCGTSCMTLLEIEPRASEASAGWAKFDTLAGLERYGSEPEESCVWYYYNDDNAIYCPENPLIGNTVVANFYGNHAEGGSVRAIGKYSHAEGRKNVADVRYAHAEGSHNFAGGMASHCEGMNNSALGNSAHAEGQYTAATGNYSHAAGNRATALANNQWVWSNGTSYGAALSAKTGTFCINPTGGLSGFYIGSKSIYQHMFDFGAATIKNDIKASLSACFEGVSDPEDIDTVSVIKALSSIYVKVK